MADHMDREYARYCKLMDRLATGETLTQTERAFCARVEAHHPACQPELQFLSELEDMDAPTGDAARQLVTATMAAIDEGALEGPDAHESHRHEQLAARLRRTRHKRILGGAAAIAAAALAVWVTGTVGTPEGSDTANNPSAAAPGPPRVELVYASGNARIDGTPWMDAVKQSALLRQRQRIQVTTGTACFVLDPDINVCLGAHGDMSLTEIDGAHRRLTLHRGRVSLALSTQPPNSSLTVVANGVESTAVGTVFSVAAQEDGHVQTTVLEGKVRVMSAGQSELVSAHKRHQVDARGRRTEPLSRRDEAPEWAALQSTRLWRDRLAGTLTIGGSPARATVWLDGKRIGRTPLSSLVPAGVHKLMVRQGGNLLLDEIVDLQAGHSRSFSYNGSPVGRAARSAREQDGAGAGDGSDAPRRAHASVAGAQSTARARTTPNGKRTHAENVSRSRRRLRETGRAATSREGRRGVPSPGQLLSEARRLMLAGQFDRAAQTYEAVRREHPGTPEARTVLVPLAELQLDRLGKPVAALGLVETYLKSGGALSHEARYLRVRTLARLGRWRAERSAIEALLANHPNSFHAKRLQRRLAQLDR